MNKVLLTIILLLTAFVGYANVQGSIIIPLEVGIIDPTAPPKPIPKNPIVVPSVMQDDYEIRFLEIHPYYTLCIVDEDDEVVYSVAVWSFTTSIVLPSWLSGDYEIQLRPDDNYYLYGYIEL